MLHRQICTVKYQFDAMNLGIFICCNPVSHKTDSFEDTLEAVLFFYCRNIYHSWKTFLTCTKIACARFCRYLDTQVLHGVAPGSAIKPGIKIDKPLVAYRFGLDNIEYLTITNNVKLKKIVSEYD